MMEDGIRIILFRCQIDLFVVRVYPEPGSSVRKTGIFFVIPLERCSGIVPSVFFDQMQCVFWRRSGVQSDLIRVDGTDVVHLIEGVDLEILHPEFLPLIDPGKPLQKEESGRQAFFAGDRLIPLRDIAGDTARLIMVFDDVADETDIRNLCLRLENDMLIVLRRDILIGLPAFLTLAEDRTGKIIHGREVPVISDKIGQFLRFLIKYFADSEGVMGMERPVTHLCQKISHTDCLMQLMMDGAETVITVGLIILEGQRFLDIDDRIKPEAVQPLIQPPVYHIINFFSEVRIFPIQIGLLFVEHMQIVFIVMSGQFVPDRSAEIRAPVTGERFAFFYVCEIKEFAVLSVRILAGFFEPFMFVGAVIDHEIHQNIQITLMCFLKKPIHIRHGSETGVDLSVIRDIIALIRQWGHINRRKPDDIDTQILQIVKFADDARQITDAVSVAVAETLRIDLISCHLMPPLFFHVCSPFCDQTSIARAS